MDNNHIHEISKEINNIFIERWAGAFLPERRKYSVSILRPLDNLEIQGVKCI